MTTASQPPGDGGASEPGGSILPAGRVPGGWRRRGPRRWLLPAGLLLASVGLAGGLVVLGGWPPAGTLAGGGAAPEAEPPAGPTLTSSAPLQRSPRAAGERGCLPAAQRARAAAEVSTAVAVRERVVDGAPPGGWLDRLADDSPELADEEARRLDVIASLPVTGFDTTVVAGTVAPLDDADPCEARAWEAVAEHAVEFDAEVAMLVRERVTLARDGSRWSVTGWQVAEDVASGGRAAPWDLGPVVAARGERSLVLAWHDAAGAAGGAGLAETQERAEQAVARAETGSAVVDGFLGTSWPRVTLVYLPATGEQYAALVPGDQEPDDDVIAAVAADYPSPDGVRDVVVVNPTSEASLDDDTWLVTYAHELTHVASGVLHGDTQPLWLAEGYADRVGWSLYVPGQLSREDVAEALLDRVAAGEGPGRLPTVADFTSDDPEVVADSYEGSWLAVEMLADELGDDALLALYEDASRGEGAAEDRLDRALREATGRGLASFEQEWLARLAELSGA